MVYLFVGYLLNVIFNKFLDVSDIFFVCFNKNELYESVDFFSVFKICR